MDEVNLQTLDINIETARRTAAGCVLLAIKDKEKTATLTNHLRSVIGNDASVYRPTRTTPILVLGIPDWMDQDQIINDIKSADPCMKDIDIHIRENIGGGRVASLRVPMEAAAKLDQGKYIRVGWSQCRVKLIEPKRPMCFRCQSPGDLRSDCKATEMIKKCYRCHQPGHLVADCRCKPVSNKQKDDGAPTSGRRTPPQ